MVISKVTIKRALIRHNSDMNPKTYTNKRLTTKNFGMKKSTLITKSILHFF